MSLIDWDCIGKDGMKGYDAALHAIEDAIIVQQRRLDSIAEHLAELDRWRWYIDDLVIAMRRTYSGKLVNIYDEE